MEKEIDDPLFKSIVLATIVCSILFVANRPTNGWVGKKAKVNAIRATVTQTSHPITTPKQQLIKSKPSTSIP